MKLTDALLGEHGLFYALFEELKTKLAQGDDVRPLMDAIGTTLEQHAQIEERMLFPALDPHIGEMGPLAVMRDEHRQIDGFLADIRDAADDADLAPLIHGLLEVIYSHFQKEEMILFHLAEQFLGEQTLSELGADWAIERKVNLDTGGCAAA